MAIFKYRPTVACDTKRVETWPPGLSICASMQEYGSRSGRTRSDRENDFSGRQITTSYFAGR
ncbi:MAG: hypothetical protein SXA11_08930 [Cyanobacteriota bacterium]|nr:hypothetical protein [Cyanobacteriota bacterium]